MQNACSRKMHCSQQLPPPSDRSYLSPWVVIAEPSWCHGMEMREPSLALKSPLPWKKGGWGWGGGKEPAHRPQGGTRRAAGGNRKPRASSKVVRMKQVQVSVGING